MEKRICSIGFLLFCMTILLTSSAQTNNIGCLDKNGNPVDWYIVYKIPELKDNSNPLISEGFGHFYMDSNNPNWILSSVSMNDSNQAIGYTLQQMYNHKTDENVFYMFYNDEFPNGSWSEISGHVKGDLLFDKNYGFWLVHSLPKFPTTDQYTYAPNARYYGQNALCMSYSYASLKTIGQQLLFMNPWIYGVQLPSFMATDNPELASTIAGNTVTTPPYNRSVTLTTVGGTQFVDFAKAAGFGKDIYYDWMAPTLQCSLDAETWQNNGGDLGSWCDGKYSVHNIEKIQLPNQITFLDTDDHSKWAVAEEQLAGWTCMGDVNRQVGQLKRGGGMVCLKNPSVWNAFHSAVVSVQNCETAQEKLIRKQKEIVTI